MKYCKVEGLRYSEDIAKCRACGSILVEASAIVDEHDNVAFPLATLSCPNPSCAALVAAPKTNFCAMCGIELKPISYELWIDKFVIPALEIRLAEVVIDPSDLFSPIAQLGLARSEARTLLDSLLADRTGVDRQVLDRWIEETVCLMKDSSQREAAMQEAIREAKKLNITIVHATSIVDVLNQRIELPTPSSVSFVEDPLEAKSGTREPESLRASAKSFYRRLVAGGSVTNNLVYLDFKKSASKDGLSNSDELLRKVSSDGAFVLFVSDENKGWVFPNPKLDFNLDSLKTLFPTLTADRFDKFKGHIEPVPVIHVGKDRWRVEPPDRSQNNQSNNAVAVEPKTPQSEAAPIVFPVSAADCLAKTANSAKVVRHDVARNLLVAGPNGKGELALVHSSTISKKGGALFVVPRITRFTSADTFHTLYMQYYECAKPSDGEVWIIKPAVVAKAPGGWHLTEKGRLEIDFVAKSPPIRDPKPEVKEPRREEVRKIEPEVVRQEPPIARRLVEWRLRLAIGIIASVVLLAAVLVAIRRGPGPTVGNRNASPTPSPANMVRIPGGVFQMGNDAGDEYEKPAHKEIVTPFLMDANEVTCEEYLIFVKAKNHRAPSNWIGGQYPSGAAKKPVTGVDWDDATAYASWAKKRLPTEAEWEFAARGTDGRRYPWGNDWQRSAANAGDSNGGQLAEVGSYPAGKGPFGTMDMIGNAWEWTADQWQGYPRGPIPPDASTKLRVIRGGFWGSSIPKATTTFRRGWDARGASQGYQNTGFRCAADVKAETSKK